MNKTSITILPIPVPIRLTTHGEKILKEIGEKSALYLAELFEKAVREDTLHMLWSTNNDPYMLWDMDNTDTVISNDESGGVFTYIPKTHIVIKRKEFKPVPIMLTDHGFDIVNASANFREAEHIYMLEPATEDHSVKVGVDEKGSTFMYVPIQDIMGKFYGKLTKQKG